MAKGKRGTEREGGGGIFYVSFFLLPQMPPPQGNEVLSTIYKSLTLPEINIAHENGWP